MPEFVDIFINSFNLIFSLNPDLLEIIFLSLKISFFSLLFCHRWICNMDTGINININIKKSHSAETETETQL